MSSKQEYQRSYYLLNKEKICLRRKELYLAGLEQEKKRAADYYRTNRSHLLAKQRARSADPVVKARHKIAARRCHLKKTYGLSPDAFQSLLDRQGNVCAACGTKEPGGKYKVWSIDHDHKCCPGRTSCGRCIRGLLCGDCNIVLGLVKDNTTTLLRLATYLGGTPNG